MTSFQTSVTPSRRAAARFIGGVRRALQKALVDEAKKTGLSQSEVARRIGVHRSIVNRELRGVENLSLGRVAELAWAMNRKPVLELLEIAPVAGSNQHHIPEQREMAAWGFAQNGAAANSAVAVGGSRARPQASKLGTVNG